MKTIQTLALFLIAAVLALCSCHTAEAGYPVVAGGRTTVVRGTGFGYAPRTVFVGGGYQTFAAPAVSYGYGYAPQVVVQQAPLVQAVAPAAPVVAAPLVQEQPLYSAAPAVFAAPAFAAPAFAPAYGYGTFGVTRGYGGYGGTRTIIIRR